MAARRPTQNAIASGTAVSASATLCSVSPSSATEPDQATMTAWSAAVTMSTANEMPSTRMPLLLDSSALSVLPALS